MLSVFIIRALPRVRNPNFSEEPCMEYPSCQHIEQYLVPGKRCHLVGIGGVSMRPLGLVLQGMGLQVTGSDMNLSLIHISEPTRPY